MALHSIFLLLLFVNFAKGYDYECPQRKHLACPSNSPIICPQEVFRGSDVHKCSEDSDCPCPSICCSFGNNCASQCVVPFVLREKEHEIVAGVPSKVVSETDNGEPSKNELQLEQKLRNISELRRSAADVNQLSSNTERSLSSSSSEHIGDSTEKRTPQEETTERNTFHQNKTTEINLFDQEKATENNPFHEEKPTIRNPFHQKKTIQNKPFYQEKRSENNPFHEEKRAESNPFRKEKIIVMKPKHQLNADSEIDDNVPLEFFESTENDYNVDDVLKLLLNIISEDDSHSQTETSTVSTTEPVPKNRQHDLLPQTRSRNGNKYPLKQLQQEFTSNLTNSVQSGFANDTELEYNTTTTTTTTETPSTFPSHIIDILAKKHAHDKKTKAKQTRYSKIKNRKTEKPVTKTTPVPVYTHPNSTWRSSILKKLADEKHNKSAKTEENSKPLQHEGFLKSDESIELLIKSLATGNLSTVNGVRYICVPISEGKVISQMLSAEEGPVQARSGAVSTPPVDTSRIFESDGHDFGNALEKLVKHPIHNTSVQKFLKQADKDRTSESRQNKTNVSKNTTTETSHLSEQSNTSVKHCSDNSKRENTQSSSENKTTISDSTTVEPLHVTEASNLSTTLVDTFLKQGQDDKTPRSNKNETAQNKNETTEPAHVPEALQKSNVSVLEHGDDENRPRSYNKETSLNENKTLDSDEKETTLNKNETIETSHATEALHKSNLSADSLLKYDNSEMPQRSHDKESTISKNETLATSHGTEDAHKSNISADTSSQKSDGEKKENYSRKETKLNGNQTIKPVHAIEDSQNLNKSVEPSVKHVDSKKTSDSEVNKTTTNNEKTSKTSETTKEEKISSPLKASLIDSIKKTKNDVALEDYLYKMISRALNKYLKLHYKPLDHSKQAETKTTSKNSQTPVKYSIDATTPDATPGEKPDSTNDQQKETTKKNNTEFAERPVVKSMGSTDKVVNDNSEISNQSKNEELQTAANATSESANQSSLSASQSIGNPVESSVQAGAKTENLKDSSNTDISPSTNKKMSTNVTEIVSDIGEKTDVQEGNKTLDNTSKEALFFAKSAQAVELNTFKNITTEEKYLDKNSTENLFELGFINNVKSSEIFFNNTEIQSNGTDILVNFETASLNETLIEKENENNTEIISNKGHRMPYSTESKIIGHHTSDDHEADD